MTSEPVVGETVPGPNPPGEERWRAVRYPVNVTTNFYPAGAPPGALRTAKVRDISTTGLGLLVDCPLEGGTRLAVEMQLTQDGIGLSLCARVTRCLPRGDGLWTADCEFGAPLRDDEVEVLVEANASGGTRPEV
jgi:hypothetical protein